MTVAETIDAIAAEMNVFPSWEERYSYIIAASSEERAANTSEAASSEERAASSEERAASGMESGEWRVDRYRVKGCQSQVWLYPEFDGERIHFLADSDAVIVKGLIAIVMRILNHRTPDEILTLSNDQIATLGLSQHLSVNRANGLASLIKQIMLYAVAFKAKGAMA